MIKESNAKISLGDGWTDLVMSNTIFQCPLQSPCWLSEVFITSLLMKRLNSIINFSKQFNGLLITSSNVIFMTILFMLNVDQDQKILKILIDLKIQLSKESVIN